MSMTIAKPIDLISRYITLRDKMQAADKEYAEWRKLHFDTPMKEIEDHFTNLFEETGADNMKTKSGTVYRKLNSSVTTAVDLIKAGKEPPPGINYSTHMSIHIQRPKE
jgi:hypothetical protein